MAATAPPSAVSAIEVALTYMDLSNQHRLEAVYKLFRQDATYKSDALGSSWSGLEEIKSMMGVRAWLAGWRT